MGLTEMVDMPEEMKNQIKWLAKRLGFESFIVAGWKDGEFRKHVLTKGGHAEGAPKIAVNANLAGMAYVIAQLLCDFPFSYDLRRAVMSIINTVETGRLMKQNAERPE